MSKIDDGGPAFPIIPPCTPDGPYVPGYPYPEPGMSLRDWFAGQALIGVVTTLGKVRDQAEYDAKVKAGAEIAFEFADAMIKARGHGQD